MTNQYQNVNDARIERFDTFSNSFPQSQIIVFPTSIVLSWPARSFLKRMRWSKTLRKFKSRKTETSSRSKYAYTTGSSEHKLFQCFYVKLNTNTNRKSDIGLLQ